MNRSIVAIFFSFIVLIIFGFEQADADLWWDEFTSLDGFILVDYYTTVSFYPEPNNHIFYNLIGNTVTRIYRIRELTAVMDNVSLLRWTQVIFSMMTLIMTYLTGKKLNGEALGLTSMIILATSLPFLNISFSLRGYNLSLLLAISVVYFSVNYMRNKKITYALLSGFFSFLLLYTIPSNLYFILALGLVLAIKWFRSLRNRTKQNGALNGKDKRSNQAKRIEPKHEVVLIPLLVCFLASLILAYIAYLPVLEQMMEQGVINRKAPERAYVLVNIFPEVVSKFLSLRYLFVVLIAVATYKFFKLEKKKVRDVPEWYSMLLLIFLIPFVMSFIRNGYPFQRTFIYLLPIFSILLAAPMVWLYRQVPTLKKRTYLVLGFFLFYGTGSLWWDYQRAQEKLSESNNKIQNISENFYQSSRYNPKEVVEKIAEHNTEKDHAIMLFKPIERIAIPFYARSHRMSVFTIKKKEERNVNVEGNSYTHIYTIQVTQGDPDGVKFGLQQFPVNLSNYPEQVHDFIISYSFAQNVSGQKGVYIVTPKSDELFDIFQKYYKDKFAITPIEKSDSYFNTYYVENI